jgi:hypothetical protein
MVTAVYFMMNVAYMTVLSIPEMTSSPAVAVVSREVWKLKPLIQWPGNPLATQCTPRGPTSLLVSIIGTSTSMT